MNNKLPPYFENMKPVLPRICDNYDIRRPSFHLPLIKYDFAEQLISYQLTTMLKGTDQTGTFMSLKCVVYYANYRSGHQSSKIQVVP